MKKMNLLTKNIFLSIKTYSFPMMERRVYIFIPLSQKSMVFGPIMD
jgi:hypothetical protein